MQPHSAANIYVPPNPASNSSGRTNQQAAGNIYRQNNSGPAQKNRYVHSNMYPTVHQSVVLGQFTAPYATRTPQLQQCQYSPQFYPQMYYPYYVRMAVPQQQRAAVNPGLGVGLGRTMALQTGGSVGGTTTTGNQGQIQMGLTQMPATTTAAKPVRLSMPHQPPPKQQPQKPPQTKEKLRSHALQIIHPITNRNILDDLETDKKGPTNVLLGDPTLTSSTTDANSNPPLYKIIGSPKTPSSTSIKSSEKLSKISETHADIVQPKEMSMNRTEGGTVCTVETNFKGKTEENIKQVADVSTTTVENSNCVQESLPTNIKQQEPKENLKEKQQEEERISTRSQLSVKISSDKGISKYKECKENCEEDKSGICNITESVISMKEEEKGNLTSLKEEQVNIIYSNEQQQQENQCSKLAAETNINTATIATTLIESSDISNNNTVAANINNNQNKKGNIVHKANTFLSLTAGTATAKSNEKLDKKINIEKSKTAATVVKVQIGANEARKTSRSSHKAITSKIEDRTKTEKVNIWSKEELLNKPKITNSSTKSTITTTPVPTPTPSTDIFPIPTIPTNNEEKKTESGNGGNEDSTESTTRSTTRDDDAADAAAENQQQQQSLISINEPQSSSSNGKKQYNREQLMQLRKAKASRIQPQVKNSSIYLPATLMPAFAYRGNKKVHPMAGGFGGARGSNCGNSNYQNFMKQNVMGGTGGADSGHHNRNSDKSIIHLNLSLNQEVKLKESDNAWLPRVLVKSTETTEDPEQNVQREKEELLRRVRGILNKLTPEKFEPLVEEIIKLKIDTLDKMEAVMILVIEKAIDEPNFSVSYASLCHRLINEVKARDERMESGTKTNLASFRTALLNKMEQEFTQNITKGTAKEEKLKPIREKISNSKDANAKVELEVLLDEEERKIRRRSGGTVRFIGELFKISILTGNIINTCIDALLKDPNNEDMLECLCKLLTTVGQKFEQTSSGKEDKSKTYSLESVIQRMHNIALRTENSKISSRVRFMLQDVIDLRKKMWQSTRNEAPKTMEQIEKEANNEQLSNSFHYTNTMPNSSVSAKRDDRGSCNDGRNIGGSHSQRGETGNLKRQQGGMAGGSHSQSGNSNADDTWHVQTGKGNRSLLVDSSKLVGMAVDMNNKKMGGAALFQWNSTSSQPTSTPSNSFAALSLDSNIGSDRDRNRDRSGPRNKGSYNKSSMERDRYDHDHKRLLSRTGATQGTRENSSYRGIQGVRGMGGGNSSNIQKSSSHSKYQQPISSTSLAKKTGMASGGTPSSSLYREGQQQSSCSDPNAIHHQQRQHISPAISETIQPLIAPPAVFKESSVMDLKLIKSVVMEMVENAANSKCLDDSVVSCLKKIKETQLCGLLYYILTDYLHLANVGPLSRQHLANVVAYLIENKYISVEHYRLAYNNFAELASDLMVDIPELWLYIFEFTGPLIGKKLITVNDLWNSQLRESGPPSFSLKFLKTFLQYCTREVGPSFTRNMLKENHIKWTSFMDENEVTKFIQTNKLEYVENANSQPDIDTKECKEKRNKRILEHIEQLLKEGSNADSVIDYINGNIIDVDKYFVNNLTTTLISFVITHTNNYSLNLPCLKNVCIPVLQHYLESIDLELECLNAVKLVDNSLKHPRGLIEAIFAELSNADVISQDTIIAWRDSAEKEN